MKLPTLFTFTAVRRHIGAALFLSSLALSGCGGGGNGEDDTHSRYVSRALEVTASADTRIGNSEGTLVGVTYGVVNAETVQLATSGVRKLGQATSLRPTDLMMICSNTKSMTGAIVGRLVERGVLSWNTRIADAIPALGATMLPVYANVTIEQLLAHRGGMISLEGEDFAAFEQCLQSYRGTLPEDEHGRRMFFVEWALREQPPAGVTPGATFLYSNADYTLVGAMLETITGKSYAQLWAEEIGQPLGIQAQWVRPELTGAPAAWGHTGEPGQVAIEPTPDAGFQAWYDIIKPAGLITIAPVEYAKWLRWHVLALRGEPTPLPSGYIKRVQAINSTNNYAVGWSTTTINGRACVGHGGSWFGYMSFAAIDLDGQRSVFGITNTNWEGADGSWVLTRLQSSAQAIDRAVK